MDNVTLRTGLYPDKLKMLCLRLGLVAITLTWLSLMMRWSLSWTEIICVIIALPCFYLSQIPMCFTLVMYVLLAELNYICFIVIYHIIHNLLWFNCGYICIVSWAVLHMLNFCVITLFYAGWWIFVNILM